MARTDSLPNFLEDVADAIKEKKGDETNILAENFDTEILALPIQGVCQSKTVSITTNHSQTVVEADPGYDTLEDVTINVNVPEKQLQARSYNFTQNTTTTLRPEQGYDGFSEVGISVNVSGGSMDPTTAEANDVLSPKTFYSNGQKLTGTIVPEYVDTAISIANRTYENNLNNSANVMCTNKDGYIAQANDLNLYLYHNGEQLAVFENVLDANCRMMTISDIYQQDSDIDMVLLCGFATRYSLIPTCKYYSVRYINNTWNFIPLSCDVSITSNSYFSNSGYGLCGKFVTTETGKYIVLLGGGNATQLRAVEMVYTPFTATSVTFNWTSLYYQYDAFSGNVNERNLLQLDAFSVENGNVIINYHDYSYKTMLIVNNTMNTILYQNYYSNRSNRSYTNSRYLFNEYRYVKVEYADEIVTITLHNKDTNEILDTLQVRQMSTNITLNGDKNGAIYVATQYSGDYVIYALSVANDTLSWINVSSNGYTSLNRHSDKLAITDYGCRAFSCTSRILEYYNSNNNKKLISLRRNQDMFRLLSPSATTVSNQVINGSIFYNSNGIQTGTMPNNGALNYTPGTSDQSIPVGYTSGGTVIGDINLISENIKAGVTIFGVTGIYDGRNGHWIDFDETFTLTGCNQTAQISDPASVYKNRTTGTVDGSNGWNYRTYLRFDLSELEALYENYRITEATLHFYLHSGNDNWTQSTYICTTPSSTYDPDTLCWNNQPSYDEAPVSRQFSMSGQSINTWIVLDIKDIVQSWLNNVSDYGLLLKGGEDAYRRNWSLRTMYEDSSYRPYIRIIGKQFISDDISL